MYMTCPGSHDYNWQRWDLNLAVDCMPKVCCGNLIWLNLPPHSKIKVFILGMLKLLAINNSLALPSVGVLPSLLSSKPLCLLERLFYHGNLGTLLLQEIATQHKVFKYWLGSLSGLGRSQKASIQFAHPSMKTQLQYLTFPLLVSNNINFFFFWLCRSACGISVPRPRIEPGPW